MGSINSVDETPSKTAARRWGSLFLAVGLLCLIIFGLAPLPINHFAPMTQYVRSAEKNGIHPGALYYTDVSVSRAAEFNSRDSVRYFQDLPR